MLMRACERRIHREKENPTAHIYIINTREKKLETRLSPCKFPFDARSGDFPFGAAYSARELNVIRDSITAKGKNSQKFVSPADKFVDAT